MLIRDRWLWPGAAVVGILLGLHFSSICYPNDEKQERAANTHANEKRCSSVDSVVLNNTFAFVGRHPSGISAGITAIATIFIAVFTFTLKRSTDKLWKAGEEQLRIATAATEATKIAANAAKISADVAEKTERPYVFLSYRIPVTFRDTEKGRIPSVNFTFTNYGRTPALISEFYAQLLVADALPNIPHYDFTSDDRGAARGMPLAPSRDFPNQTRTLNREITLKEFESVENKVMHIFS